MKKFMSTLLALVITLSLTTGVTVFAQSETQDLTDFQSNALSSDNTTSDNTTSDDTTSNDTTSNDTTSNDTTSNDTTSDNTTKDTGVESADTFYSNEHPFNFNETPGGLQRSLETARFDDDYYWNFGDTVFGLDNYRDIVKVDKASGMETVIYSDPDQLDRVYLEPEMAYLLKGNTIYRLHIPTQSIEEVFSDENLYDFIPLSNTKIRVSVYSPAYLEYVDETGDEENQTGLPETITYSVDVNTGSKEEMTVYPDETLVKMPRVSTGSYGSGKYFTKNGESCSSAKDTHGSKCSYTDPNADCNCKIYGGAIQCMGYAKYVYAQNSKTWGSSVSTSWKNSTEAQRTQAATDLKKWVEGKGTGSHMRVLNGAHSVIVTSTDTTGFNVIQANADGKNCKVTTGSYVYATIVKNYTSISTN